MARRRRGFTLSELLVVLVILAAVAAGVTVAVDSALAAARGQATEASLAAIRDAILGARGAPGYVGDCRRLPAEVADLVRRPDAVPPFDPATRLGWRGPYLLGGAGSAGGAPTVLDGWGTPIAISTAGAEVRLVSAGPDAVTGTADDVVVELRGSAG